MAQYIENSYTYLPSSNIIGAIFGADHDEDSYGPRKETMLRAIAPQATDVWRDTDGSGSDLHKAAVVTYYHHRELPLHNQFSAGHELLPEDIINSVMGSEGYSGKDLDRAVQQQEDNPQLFFHRPATIHSAFADPSMRAHIPTLLGIALNREGSNTIPDYSLSSHSSRLVQRALDKGAIQPNPLNAEGVRNNDIDMDEYLSTVYRTKSGGLMDASEVDPTDIARGKQKVREFLGRSRHLSPQFGPVGEQLKIPGLEG